MKIFSCLLLLLTIIVAGTLGLASCSASSATVSPTTTTLAVNTGTPMPVDNIEVLIENFEYAPPSITIPPGTAVTWTNRDTIKHTVTSRENTFDSGLFGKSETFSYTFTTPGEYEYYCVPHPYMVGKVIVK